MSTRKAKRKATAAVDRTQATRQPTLDGFANFTARMGAFSGAGVGNVLSDGTYLANLITRNRVILENMYRGSWIVGAAVDSIAEDMTRAGVTIKGEDDPQTIQELQASLVRMGIWSALLRAIKWGRLYGGALAMLHIDGQDPATPLDVRTVAKDQFLGLRVFDRWQVQPDTANLVQAGLNAGLPASYQLVANIESGAVSGLRIHHSRIMRFIGIELPVYQALQEQFWGESIVERIYDRLVSFDTATMGAANLIQKAHLRTVQIDKLREVLAAGGKAEENLLAMFHHMRMLQTNEGLTLLDKSDTFEAHSYTFSGLSDMILQFGQQISGATGIPLVRLFGQSPAGLNSTGESDLRMYYDNVRSQQEARLRDGLMKMLRVLHQSKFGTPAPENFDFDFEPLWQVSTKEKVDLATSVVTAVTTAVEKGTIDQTTALLELKQSSDYTGLFSNITDEQIEESKVAPPPDAPTAGATAGQAGADAPPSLIDRIKAWVTGHGQ